MGLYPQIGATMSGFNVGAGQPWGVTPGMEPGREMTYYTSYNVSYGYPNFSTLRGGRTGQCPLTRHGPVLLLPLRLFLLPKA